MEGAAIVVARGSKGEEVLARLGHGFAEELELELAARRVQLRLVSRLGRGWGQVARGQKGRQRIHVP